MLRAPWKMDPRIWSALVEQRSSIIKGLVCTAIASALTVAVLKLTNEAFVQIGRASVVAVDVTKEAAGEEELARAFEVPVQEVRERLQRISAAPEGGEQASARQSDALSQIGWISLMVVGVFALRYSFARGQQFYLSRAAARLSTSLRRRLYAKLMKLPIGYYGEKRLGGLQSVLSNDVGVYSNAIGLVRDSIDGPIKAAGALIYIFVFGSWALGLLALAFVPVIGVFVQRNNRRMRAAQAQVQEDLADLGTLSLETMNGIRVVKSFAAEGAMIGRFDSLARRSYESQLEAIRRVASLKPMVELIGASALALLIYLCGWLANWGMLAVAEIISVVLAMDYVKQGFNSIANANNVYSQVQAASERIHREVLDVEEEPIDTDGQKELPAVRGRVEFQDVRFDYPDGTAAVRGVSFVLEPGTSLALVGPSGAGKSTIADLLLRFHDPSEGRILLDGVDIRELKGAWYRRQIGVVPQQTFLFASSIEENVRLGAPEADRAAVEAACRAAHADAFLSTMPAGLETQLGEKGVRLSGGEGQRIAIARALISEPAILLLDEATSNLDTVSERIVTDALAEAMAGRTALFIAHRLSTAARATRIIVLRQGEIVEEGSHEELLAGDGFYAAMYRAQASGAEAIG